MLVRQSIGMGLRKEDAGLSVRPTLRQEAFLEGVEQDLTQLNKSDDSHNSIDRVKGEPARRLDYERQNGPLPKTRRRAMSPAIGHKRWAIAEGYIPGWSNGPEPQFTSHETACLLNTSDEDARVTIIACFSDREPAGPYRVIVPARRTLHVRFNDLEDPEPIPADTDYANVIESDVPIMVQHTRLDSRQAENALFSTIAYVSGE